MIKQQSRKEMINPVPPIRPSTSVATIKPEPKATVDDNEHEPDGTHR